MAIVFVCTANMCRSPFAEQVFRKHGRGSFESTSMGLMALPGNPATPASVRAAVQFGVDLATHRTRPLDEQVLREASAVYVFERRHKDNIELLFPGIQPRLHLLGSLLGKEDAEIADPVGGPEGSIARCYARIDEACRLLAGRLEKARSQGTPA